MIPMIKRRGNLQCMFGINNLEGHVKNFTLFWWGWGGGRAVHFSKALDKNYSCRFNGSRIPYSNYYMITEPSELEGIHKNH